MEEHYLSEQHQGVVLKVLREKLESKMNSNIFETTTNVTTTDLTIDPQMKLYETIKILTGGVKALNDDVQHANDELLQNQIKLHSLTEDISKIQLSVEESHGFVQSIKLNQDILHQDLELLKEKTNEMQYTSYDGTLLWKITNIHEKMSK